MIDRDMTFVVDHFQQPRNHGLLDDADVDCEDVNPGCGDRIRLQVRLGPADEIVRVGFVGEGCVISMAAASILTTVVEGQRLEDVVRISESSLVDALQTSISPRRLECALLAYRTLRAGLVWHVHERRQRAS